MIISFKTQLRGNEQSKILNKRAQPSRITLAVTSWLTLFTTVLLPIHIAIIFLGWITRQWLFDNFESLCSAKFWCSRYVFHVAPYAQLLMLDVVYTKKSWWTKKLSCKTQQDKLSSSETILLMQTFCFRSRWTSLVHL